MGANGWVRVGTDDAGESRGDRGKQARRKRKCKNWREETIADRSVILVVQIQTVSPTMFHLSSLSRPVF